VRTINALAAHARRFDAIIPVNDRFPRVQGRKALIVLTTAKTRPRGLPYETDAGHVRAPRWPIYFIGHRPRLIAARIDEGAG